MSDIKEKPNREELRRIMLEYRLNSEHVAKLIHVTPSRVRTFASAKGADISKASLELLQYKVEGVKNVSIG